MLKRIPTPEEYELEKAYKALKLNAGPVSPIKLVAASSQKPTVRIKRLYPSNQKLKSASTIQKEMDREKQRLEERVRAEKVLRFY